MKQNRSTVALVALAVLAAVGLPFYISNNKASALNVETASLRSQEKALLAKSLAGDKVRKKFAEWTKAQDVLAAAMPADTDVQGAIRTLQAVAAGTGETDRVTWISGTTTGLVGAKAPVVPTTAATVKGAKPVATTIAPVDTETPPPSGGFALSITVEGSRANVLAFVSRIQQKPEQLPRLFSVRSVALNLAPVAAVTTGTSAAPIAQETGDTAPSTAVIQLKVTTFGVAKLATTADASFGSTTTVKPA